MANRKAWSWIVLLALLWWCRPQGAWVDVPVSGNVQETGTEGEWVVKWRKRADPAFFREVEVLQRSGREGTSEAMLVRIRSGVEKESWQRRWSRHRDVEFLHPNFPYGLEQGEGGGREQAEAAGSFYYLKKIRADKAWELVRRQRHPQGLPRPVVVAVVDTGVDLDHPVLKPLLVPGVNVRNRLRPPQDEMGHGTRVAGVVAAVWGAFSGQKAAEIGRIMPIKVMDSGNDGEIWYTVEGMREAVRRGANIIVLAQGSWTWSELMVQAVREAEARGVLVVGAAGNAVYGPDGGIAYDRPLYVPAAIPEVLSVGSIRGDGSHEPSSNSGPGLDLSAPGELIHTAGLSRRIDIDSGTSYAAPQAAAVAAMVLQTRPTLTPAQIRSLLCQTADRPPGKRRWDEQTGFGVLNAENALKAPLLPDMFEPNNRPEAAFPVSTGHEIRGVAEPGEEDWYGFTFRHPGMLTLRASGAFSGEIRLRAVLPSGRTVEVPPGKPLLLTSVQGTVRVGLSASGSRARPVPYGLAAEYHLLPDPFEENDEPWQASLLPAAFGDTAYEATLHRAKDADWYKLILPSDGEVQLRIEPLSPRFDPVITVLTGGNWRGGKVDAGSEGEAEQASFSVREEEILFFRVTDYGGNPGDEPYRLFVRVRTSGGVSAEPGIVSSRAAGLRPGRTYSGRIRDAADLDWYVFNLSERSELGWMLQAPQGWKGAEWALYDRGLRALDSWAGTLAAGGKKRWNRLLPPGRYYLRIRTVDQKNVTYRLNVTKKKLARKQE